MNWIKNFVRPKIRSILGTDKREVPKNMWVKDPESGQMVFYKDLEANQYVMPQSGYHMRMPPEERLKSMFDDGACEKIAMPQVPADPLKFRDERKYADRIKEARTKNGVDDCIQAGAGEAIVTAMRKAVEKKTPFIFFISSGGARMQEGVLSLMQMPRTTVAVQELRAARLPYIVVLTHPTTGGVTASYAMLGDVHVAEPGALIGFAGQRVIEQTIREKLPEGFQRAEYLEEHGMVDIVVHRHEMRGTLSRMARMLMKAPSREVPSTALVPAEG
jgi:acetyl-CoA carboxylase carboxyl transferase subunit beta